MPVIALPQGMGRPAQAVAEKLAADLGLQQPLAHEMTARAAGVKSVDSKLRALSDARHFPIKRR